MQNYVNYNCVCIQSDCPGPAAYVGQSTFEDKRTSYSKRGFGGLVTKVFTLLPFYKTIKCRNFMMIECKEISDIFWI